MLSQSERLSRPRISELLKKGRRHSGALFDIRYATSTHFEATVIVSKKVAPLSVRRHLLKRRMNAALRAKKQQLVNMHIAIVLKKTNHPPSSKEYTLALEEFIRKDITKGV